MTRAKGRREMAEDLKDVEYFNVFDGVKGRPVSTYLDMQERIQAERSRAIAEGREPETDLGKLPAAVGTPLVTAANQVDNSLLSNPPMSYAQQAKTVDPQVILTVDFGTGDDDVDYAVADQYAAEDLIVADDDTA